MGDGVKVILLQYLVRLTVYAIAMLCFKKTLRMKWF